MLSITEENYIKAIFHLSNQGKGEVSTNSIADSLKTAPATVTDMIKKLSKKGWVDYKKYRGVQLEEKGLRAALKIIRKHRLWEYFLVSKLKFSWDEVHEVAEQLEHIKSPLLTKRLDEFLGYPDYDPHGDPIPREDGTIAERNIVQLNEIELGQRGKVAGVNDSNSDFLKYLDKIGIALNSEILVLDRVAFDGSIEIRLNDSKIQLITKEVAQNIFISV